MFDYVRSHQKLIQIVLALIMVPFAFWGIDSYVRGGDATRMVATVGSQAVSQAEFDQALRGQQDRMRGMFGKAYDPEKFDTPQSRGLLLNSLVERHLIAGEVAHGHLMISDADLRDTLLGIGAFQENGKFSMARFDAYARSQGMSAPEFEAMVRSDLTLRQLTDTIEGTAIGSKTALARWDAINEQEREVSEASFPPAQFAEQVKITPEQIKQYYEANSRNFEAPLQLRAEYVVLSLDKLSADVAVTDDEIKAWYDAHQTQYTTAEQRQASHILISAAKDAPGDARKKARARAEELLAEVKKNPASFAALAKKNSQDPGSAAKGGDLGLFSRGMMVKPFDDTAFSMKEGQISPVVETDFGYHVIRLDKIKAAGVRPLAEVRADIERGLRKERAQKKFADLAEAFSNTVYEQADSLQPAADKFKLQIQRIGPFAKRDAASAAPALNNEKLLNALFGDDAIKNKHNTEAVETAPNTLVSARVVEAQPARLRSLAESEPAITAVLRTQEAAKLARSKAEAAIAELQKGGHPDLKWSAAKTVSRGSPMDLKPPAIDAVFRVATVKLPTYAMADSADAAPAVFRVSAVKAPAQADAEKRKKREEQLAQSMTREDLESYLAALRAKTKVEINKANLERKER